MKVADAIGAQLDWMVAKCEPNMLDLYYSDDNKPLVLEEAPDYYQEWEPSTNWAQGGPIIDREKIGFWIFADADNSPEEVWVSMRVPFIEHGPTPLIAAMRCYVASKLGDEVEIPEELA